MIGIQHGREATVYSRNVCAPLFRFVDVPLAKAQD